MNLGPDVSDNFINNPACSSDGGRGRVAVMNRETQPFVLHPDSRNPGKTMIECSLRLTHKVPLLVQRRDSAPLPAVEAKQANTRHWNELCELSERSTTDYR